MDCTNENWDIYLFALPGESEKPYCIRKGSFFIYKEGSKFRSLSYCNVCGDLLSLANEKSEYNIIEYCRTCGSVASSKINSKVLSCIEHETSTEEIQKKKQLNADVIKCSYEFANFILYTLL